MDPNELLTTLRDVKTSVEASTKAMDARITVVENDYKKDLADLKESVKVGTHDEETLKGFLNDVLKKQEEERNAALALPGGGTRITGDFKMPNFWGQDMGDMIRASEFDIDRAIMELDGKALVDTLCGVPALDDNHRYLQQLATDVWICDSIAKSTAFAMNKQYAGFTNHFPKLSKVWGKYLSAYLQSMGKAIDTATSGAASEWVPTRFTSEVMELIKNKTRVAAAFEHFTMPGSPYVWPVDLTDTLGKFKAETTTVTNPYDDTEVQTVVSALVTFTAKKMRGRMVTTGEMTEDAMFPIIPQIRKRIVEIQANNEETAVINGDTAATHQDADIDAVTGHPAKAWLGLRAWCIDKSKTTDVNSATNLDAFVTIRAAMDEHGADTEDLIYVSSIAKAIKLITSDKVQTVDKYGGSATILRGELGKIYGVPLLAARYMPIDQNASGVNDGTTELYTSYLCANRRCWMVGDLREPTLEAERLINTDQVNIVSWRRLDFEHMYGSAATKSAAWLGIKVAE